MDDIFKFTPSEPIVISVNVDKLVDYVMLKADKHYSDDFPIPQIEIWIREFFKEGK